MVQSVITAYYAAYRAGDAAAVSEALSAVLADDVSLDSPLVREKLGGPLVGKEAVLKSALGVAPVLKGAEVKALYAQLDSESGGAALIEFPTPVGVVTQSEHFIVDPVSKKIKSLVSLYDPRKLLALAAQSAR